ncbi:hypothetical protein [Hoeflea sp.]|uniref:hypothetical protein n=1 Tax=Hoeflea sp. TaxID=1940281 RepID=UPI003B01A7A9
MNEPFSAALYFETAQIGRVSNSQYRTSVSWPIETRKEHDKPVDFVLFRLEQARPVTRCQADNAKSDCK